MSRATHPTSPNRRRPSPRPRCAPARAPLGALTGAVALLVTGCALPSDPPVHYDPGLVGALQVMRVLAPGAQRVAPFEPLPFQTPGDAFLASMGQNLQVSQGGDGRRLFHLLLATSTSSTVANRSRSALFAVDAEGRFHPLERPAAAGPLVHDPRRAGQSLSVGAVPSSAAPRVLECLPGTPGWLFTLSTDAGAAETSEAVLVATAVPPASCAALFAQAVGAADTQTAAPEQAPVPDVLLANASAQTLTVDRLALSTGARTPLWSVSVEGAVRPRALWVGALPAAAPRTAGVHVLLDSGATTFEPDETVPLTLLSEGGAVARAEGVGLVARAHRDARRPGFWLEGVDDRQWWWPDGGAPVAVEPAPDAALVGDATGGEAGPWSRGTPGGPAFRLEAAPNPDDPTLGVPVRALARVTSFSDQNIPTTTVLSAATTPCAQRTACRQYGESYLISTLATGDAPPASDLQADPEAAPTAWGIYAWWSWTGELALFTAPLLRDDGSDGTL